jgi:hypothetical protein
MQQIHGLMLVFNATTTHFAMTAGQNSAHTGPEQSAWMACHMRRQSGSLLIGCVVFSSQSKHLNRNKIYIRAMRTLNICFGVARYSANLPIFQDYGRYATVKVKLQKSMSDIRNLFHSLAKQVHLTLKTIRLVV